MVTSRRELPRQSSLRSRGEPCTILFDAQLAIIKGLQSLTISTRSVFPPFLAYYGEIFLTKMVFLLFFFIWRQLLFLLPILPLFLLTGNYSRFTTPQILADPARHPRVVRSDPDGC